MTKIKHATKYREDYQVTTHLIQNIFLTFKLHENSTEVEAKSTFVPNPTHPDGSEGLYLFGENLKLKAIKINGIVLREDSYKVDQEGLMLTNLPDDQFELSVTTEVDPENNTSLEGLYRSSGNFCTQCEAEGFRKITYYLDRPDVMSRFITRIEGCKEKCPVMLSNGNCIEKGDLPGNRHYAVWEDPFPKPSYLFALVAGKLVCIKDTFTTKSGREINLEIYVEEKNREKCSHAMTSLQKAMHWDEEVFGLEYDLDIYMIVAVDDFNMGAMENKGLNIFNSKYVLAIENTATDQDYLNIEGVIAHEYFHNWTGNRVTCRDWFQLSLKEGLTVFRDQEFSSDMNSRAVQRIDDVQVLRDYQFREDAGPMAHPVRPDSYVEINNFYTVTVYNKGAEVIRMIHLLLGKENFRKGMDLYFKRHDGQAVTCDDFVAAMADGSGINLDQFKLWYSQAGTPELTVTEAWNEKDTYSLTISQTCKPTPGQPEKKPFHIPVTIDLLGTKGNSLLSDKNETVLNLCQTEQTFTFTEIFEKPYLSFNRNFSAPVKVVPFQDRQTLAFLMGSDSNLFNRWEASSVLAVSIIKENIIAIQQNKKSQVDECFIDAIAQNLKEGEDKSLISQAITLPSEMYMTQQIDIIDPDALHYARKEVMHILGDKLFDLFLETYEKNSLQASYLLDSESIGKRRLKNCCLSYLIASDKNPEHIIQLAEKQYYESTNMTDKIAALKELSNLEKGVREKTLADFYSIYENDPLVMDKWFSLQAISLRKECLEDVQKLMKNQRFSMDNPNKVRALIGAFASANHVRFHDISGKGYTFLADQIIQLNKINPQIAARLVSPLVNWKRYDVKRQELMRKELKRIGDTPNISPDVQEIVSKSL